MYKLALKFVFLNQNLQILQKWSIMNLKLNQAL